MLKMGQREDEKHERPECIKWLNGEPVSRRAEAPQMRRI
jgi:hypothetical protein